MKTIGEVVFEDAQRRLLANLKLLDWQVPDDACENCDNTLNDGMDTCDQCGGAFVSPHREEYTVAIEAKDDRIDITMMTADNRVGGTLWLEVEDGTLKVHAYDNENEGPVSLRIFPRPNPNRPKRSIERSKK
jgi:hypothetical protein